MTLEKHHEAGAAIKTLLGILEPLALEFSARKLSQDKQMPLRVYRYRRKSGERVRKVLTALEDLRCELDNLLAEEYPGLSNAEFFRVYYSGQSWESETKA